MKRLNKNKITIKKNEFNSNVDIIIYVNKILEAYLEDESIRQLINISLLPGVIKNVIAMPDIHTGYGFPIGGIAAFDFNNGIILPGGVGYDINCGIRIMRTDLKEKDIINNIDALLYKIFNAIPGGVGSRSRILLNKKEFRNIIKYGMKYVRQMGFANDNDLQHTESNGYMETDITAVSNKAIERGLIQQNTLGSGNHFIEIQIVEEIYDKNICSKWHIFENQICIMIHTGSRGFGHQVCTDALKDMQKFAKSIIDRQLVYSKLHSIEGEKYFNAMKCAANYAWANRQFIMNEIRNVFNQMGYNTQTLHFDLLYDVSHNIAKIEHFEDKKLIVHRKGATRAFPPGNRELSKDFIKTGQPVIVPGDMGSNSYILRGTQKAYKETFASAAHGAGRLLSRKKALKMSKNRNIANELNKCGIKVLCASQRTIREEMPEAYKNIDEVVNVMHDSGIALKIAKLRSIGVIKG